MADLISVETLKVYSQVCHRVDITHLEANLALVETFQASFRVNTYRITQLKPMPVTEQDLVMLKYLALAAVAKAKAGAGSLDNYLMPILAQATDLNSLLHAIWCHDQADVIMANLAEGLFDDGSIIAGADMGESLIKQLDHLYEAVFDLMLKLELSLTPTEIQQKWLESFLYLIDILEYSYLPISYDCLKAIYDDITQNGVAAIDLLIKEGISFGIELD